MVDAAASIGGEVYKDGKSLISYFSKKINYAKNLKKNYEAMMEEAKKLYGRRDDLDVELKKDKTKQATKEYLIWIDKVTEAANEIKQLEERYELKATKKGDLMSWSRSQLSKRIAEKMEELRILRENDGKFENGIAVEGPPQSVRIIHAPNTKGIPSLHFVVDEVLELLRDSSIKRIGVWGMVGTGKTTIMQNLNNNKDMDEMFDIVIWISVSKDWCVEKLQKVIMNRLKMSTSNISNQDDMDTAWRISQELESKRYLLLLDEVWENLDLHAVGIRNNHDYGKVVIATRFRHIFLEMETDEQVNVKRLSNVDALKMFHETVGRNIQLPGVRPLAEQVVKECAGLPLLIDKVAKTFRMKDNIHLWGDGLRKLRRWPSIRIQGMDEVLEFLKYCYEDLDGDDKKFCFLYTALYPEDHDIYIDYLLECWRSENFICIANRHGDVHHTFRDAFDKGHTILHDLINVSLLERSENLKHIRMNKVLRNMALKISSHNNMSNVLVNANEGLTEPPRGEEWKNVHRISLMDNKLRSLPEKPDCKDLLTLMLQRNSALKLIPDLFFMSMQNLQVLDLHDTQISSLPSSLNGLKGLRALYLNSCKNLCELPFEIKALESLEVLDLRGSGINYIPRQIKGMSHLRCLRMSLSNGNSRESKITELDHNIISSLSCLEELSIDVDPHNKLWDEVVEVVTREVADLILLTSLSFCFPKMSSLEIFVTNNSLWRDFRFAFQFSVGYHENSKHRILDYFDYQISRCLRYANGEGVDPALKAILAESDAFELIGHKGDFKLSDFGPENINKMRGCLIEGCKDIKTVINCNQVSDIILESLEKIYINNVPKLESIWEGHVPIGSLTNLTTMKIHKCEQLKKIFSCGMIQQLCKLQHLIVEECHEIEELIVESENNGLESGSFPSLKSITLVDLPKLKSIWYNASLQWPCLETIKISECQMLKRLPFDNNNGNKLRCIEGLQLWWSALVWDEDNIEQRLSSICVLR